LINLTVTYHDPADTIKANRFRLSVVGRGDTSINGHQMPYLLVKAQNPESFYQDFRCRAYVETSSDGFAGTFRLYRDLISAIGLLPEDGTSAEYYSLGCGLRCFTHPQLGTIRFDSPARQAQFPDNCYYGTPVSRPGRAAATLDLRLHPNPATDRVAVKFAGWGRLEAYDAQGRQVLRREGSGPLDVDVSGWAAGLYAVRVSGPQGVSVGRLVVGR
jgi:hypothetical protein